MKVLGVVKDIGQVEDLEGAHAERSEFGHRRREHLHIAELQHLLETEWQQFSHTVAEWSRLQGEKLDAAKLHMTERVHEAQHQLQERWDASDMRQKMIKLERALEEALEMQRQRVALLRMQMAAA